jgi:hypothetical protein
VLDIVRSLKQGNGRLRLRGIQDEVTAYHWLQRYCFIRFGKLDLKAFNRLRGELAELLGKDVGDLDKMLFTEFVSELQKSTTKSGDGEGTVGNKGPAVIEQREGTGGDKGPAAAKPQRKRGRKPDTDPIGDKRVWDAWQTRQHKSYAELANALGKTKREVMQAIDRHRQRMKRRKPAPE